MLKTKFISCLLIVCVLTAIALNASFMSASAENLIDNGDFSSGIESWDFSLTNQAVASFSNDAGWGKIDITNGGSANGDVSVKQSLAEDLAVGVEYTASFTLKANASKKIEIYIRNSSTTLCYNLATLQLEEQTFTYQFTPAATLSGVYILLKVGGQYANNTVCWMDHISVAPTTEMVSTPTLAITPTLGPTVIPELDAPLSWAPPELVNPVTINLGTTDTPKLKDNTDYIITLPNVIREKVVIIDGGRNVVMMGGHIRIPNMETTSGDTERKAIYIRGGTDGRTVHIEGVLVTCDVAGQGDAIAINSPNSIVQVENFRVERLQGGIDTTAGNIHADVIQPWGGVRELRVDHLTASSHYQGFQLPANYNSNGKFIFKNINLIAEEEWYSGAKGGYMIWLDQTGSGVPTEFTNVYLQPRTVKSLGTSVWPDVNNENVENRPVISNNIATWPGLSYIKGGITLAYPGMPEYVPAGAAGIGYQTEWKNIRVNPPVLYKDAVLDSNRIQALQEGKVITTCTLSNLYNSVFHVSMITTLTYKGKLIKLAVAHSPEDSTSAVNLQTEIDISYRPDTSPSDYHLKTMLWSGLDTMEPYIQPFVYSN